MYSWNIDFFFPLNVPERKERQNLAERWKCIKFIILELIQGFFHMPTRGHLWCSFSTFKWYQKYTCSVSFPNKTALEYNSTKGEVKWTFILDHNF
jgi:hypothetical protein